eukprot:1083435-Pelagomonas_calceolata.AAC.1
MPPLPSADPPLPPSHPQSTPVLPAPPALPYTAPPASQPHSLRPPAPPLLAPRLNAPAQGFHAAHSMVVMQGAPALLRKLQAAGPAGPAWTRQWAAVGSGATGAHPPGPHPHP